VVKKGGRKEMTSVKLDSEFRELNAAQMRVNTRAAVDQIVGARVSGKKETQKSGAPGFKMMRAEEESGEVGRLPPVTEILNTRSRGAGAVENVKAIIEKKVKKIVTVPAPIIEEMELKGEEVEVDFEREQIYEGRAEIPQEILNEVARTMQGGHEGDEIEPVEILSTTFLQSIVSDRMDIDLGEDYEERVQEIVNELEESGREAEVENSPSRDVKEELIEREMSRENRKTGDGKVSSDSAEEGERLVIDDSTEGERFMIRTMRHEEGDEPAPLRDILTPILESTPCEGHEREGRKASFRPLTAPKKQMWVQPELKKGETEEEEDRKSISGESENRKSPMSVISSGRLTVTENEVPLHLREPRGYGDRATRTHV